MKTYFSILDKNLRILLMIVLAVMITSLGCVEKNAKVSPNPDQQLTFGYTSIENLIRETFRIIKHEDPMTFDYVMVSGNELKNVIFPHLPEAQNNISVEDYWGWVLPDRKKGKSFLFNKLPENIELISIGKPKKILKFGPVKLHRNIPVTLGERDEKGNLSKKTTFSKIFTAIVEINGLFRWLSITID